MHSDTWKDAERTIARLLKCRRVGPTGTDTPDLVSDSLVVEVKHREKLPQWILDALGQAEAQRIPGRLPILVLHQKQMNYRDSLVVMRLRDFQEMNDETDKRQ